MRPLSRDPFDSLRTYKVPPIKVSLGLSVAQLLGLDDLQPDLLHDSHVPHVFTNHNGLRSDHQESLYDISVGCD